MRPRLLCLTALLALILAGCGSDSSSSGSPLEDALGYLPEDAPLVVSIETDLDGPQVKAIGKIVKRFPFAGQIESSLKEQVKTANFDFDKDLKPLLGNEFVVGATDPRSIVNSDEDQNFVGAIRAKSKDKLEQVVAKSRSEEKGEKNGAKLYEGSDGDSYAIKDDVLIVAGSQKLLEDALAQREADDRLTEKTFEDGTKGLPKDALVRLYGDLQALLASDPDTKDALKVKWVKALRTFGLSASFKADAIDIDFRLGTDSGQLSEEDLPLAAGEDSPAVIGSPKEIGAGLRGLGQIVKFGESAGQAVDPRGFADYQTGRRTIEKRLGLNLDDDVLAQLSDISSSVDVNGNFAARAELKDAKEFERTLAKLAKELPGIAQGSGSGATRIIEPKGGDGLYEVRPSGDKPVFLGVVDGVLVAGNERSRATAAAKESPKGVAGAKGALVVSADAEQIVTQAVGQSQPGIGGALGGALVAGPLDRLTGSLSASTDGLVGSFRLTFD